MINRRQVLAGIGATALGACAGNPPAQAPRISNPRTGALNLILKPEQIATRYRSTITDAIDPHTHIFNGSDVQVCGFLHGPIALSQKKAGNELMCAIIRGLAKPLEKVAWDIAPNASDEYRDLITLAQRGTNALQEIDGEIVDYRSRAAESLLNEIEGKRVKRRIEELLSRSNSDFSIQSNRKLDLEYLIGAFAGNENQAQIRTLTSDEFSLRSTLKFVGLMLMPRRCNYREYMNNYTDGKNAIGVSRICASMVDMDLWIGDHPQTKSSIENQLILMQLISELSDGYVQPIAAYNPWKHIALGESYLQLIADAVSERGFVGVKIYPTMGFYPFNNDVATYPSQGRAPDLTQLNQHLKLFWDWIKTAKVPVLAHSGNSMGQTLAHDEMSHPDGWDALSSNAAYRDLPVSLGHFGGEKQLVEGGWFDQYTATMAKAKRLYGDLGMWSDINPDNPETVRALAAKLSQRINDRETVADRLMFGTDWLMLSSSPNASSYAKDMLQALEAEDVGTDVLNKLFHKNAKKLFGF